MTSVQCRTKVFQLLSASLKIRLTTSTESFTPQRTVFWLYVAYRSETRTTDPYTEDGGSSSSTCRSALVQFGLCAMYTRTRHSSRTHIRWPGARSRVEPNHRSHIRHSQKGESPQSGRDVGTNRTDKQTEDFEPTIALSSTTTISHTRLPRCRRSSQIPPILALHSFL